MNETRKQNVFLNRNFRLVFFGALASDLGAVLYSFAVSFYILEISGNNAFLQGLYLALSGVVLLLVTPVGGVLGDRFDKARIMYVCDYIKGGLILLATLGMLLFPSAEAQLGFLFAVGVLGSAVSGVFSPASSALLPYIVDEDRLQQANAYFSAKSSLQSIFGIVLAGVLYGALPIHLLFLIVGVCYLLSGVSETFIRYAYVPSEGKLTVRAALDDMRDGLRYLKAKKAVMAVMLSALFINFFFTPISSNFLPYFIKTDVAAAPSYLYDRFLTPELWSSVISMMLGVSLLAGSLYLSAKKAADKCGRQVARRLGVLALAMLGFALGYWFFLVRQGQVNALLILFSLGAAVVGFCIALINIPINTAIMRLVDKDKLSKVSSIMTILAMGLIPISSVAAGSVLQLFGSMPLLVISAAGLGITALFSLTNHEIQTI